MKKEDLKIENKLVMCSNCGNFASWENSINVGWIGCSPCIIGEADSFDSNDLIAESCIDDFLKKFNKK